MQLSGIGFGERYCIEFLDSQTKRELSRYYLFAELYYLNLHVAHFDVHFDWIDNDLILTHTLCNHVTNLKYLYMHWLVILIGIKGGPFDPGCQSFS